MIKTIKTITNNLRFNKNKSKMLVNQVKAKAYLNLKVNINNKIKNKPYLHNGLILLTTIGIILIPKRTTSQILMDSIISLISRIIVIKINNKLKTIMTGLISIVSKLPLPFNKIMTYGIKMPNKRSNKINSFIALNKLINRLTKSLNHLI